MALERYAAGAAFLSLALVGGAQAPITLVSPGNVPENGTSFVVQRGAYIAPAAGGEDILFDFSAAAPASSATYQWHDPASLPNGAHFPGAQYALTNGGPDTLFYQETASGLERIGDTQTITALGTAYHLGTTYSNSALDLELPLGFGDAWSDLFSGSFTVAGEPTAGQRDGGINGVADAWGRVVMPGGADTVEVLRVKTRVTETIPLTISGFALTVNHVHNITAYVPLWGKFPVLRSVSDSLTSMVLNLNDSYTEWLDPASVGVPEQAARPLAMHVFPNPAKDRATVLVNNAQGGPVTVDVFDVRGARVLHEEGRDRAVAIDLGQWGPGVYQVVATNGLGQRNSARLVVAR